MCYSRRMLERLFSPKSIAIVGASRTPGKLGHDVLMNVKKFGYQGKIYPINPKAEEIEGLPAYSTVLDIPGKVDVAVVAVPVEFVPEVIRDCGRKHIKFAVVITAGFKEIGEQGVEREKAVKKAAEKYGVHIVGPNCLGYLNAYNKLNASFAVGIPSAGNISLVSQSGAMGVALLDWAYQSQLGFSKIITVGNKMDIDEVDCLEFFARDKHTDVILMYLESIEDGEAFMQAAAAVSKKKPIVVLKAGRSEQAKKAVSSHTGSLAGSEAAIDAAFEKSGVIRARTVEEFFDYGLAFSLQPLPKGGRIAIITNAGGPGIMAVDAVPQTDIQLPTLSAKVQKKLSRGLPPAANMKNPVDVIGDAPPERYEHALKSILSSSEVDGAVVILTPQVMTDEDTTARIVAWAQKEYKKPIVTSFMGGVDVNSGRVILDVHGIPNYETPERAVKAMNQLVKQQQKEVIFTPAPTRKSTRKQPSSGKHVQIKTVQAEKILETYKLPVLRSKLITTPKDCEKIKEFPVVMKVASRDVVHKAASGAVVLNIEDAKQAKRAFNRIKKSVKKHVPGGEFDGVLVQPQLEFGTHTSEVIIGMKRDPSFGPMVMFGLGGSLVEYFHDVSFCIAPLTLAEAEAMIQRIQTAPLLKHNDIRAAARTLVAVGKIAYDYPSITELDINPMILQQKGKGGSIVDVRMMTH